ncbi:hypothetical protein EJ04DRAFT_577514 [Polyplosphaeria fusca]|uniref:Uncharacterized protein n=1 Tax=Polyplosphaeria fusca TaxID=682080 RepID=A0A9P4QTM8_9PLEO|nr:hypothetical protein EJ04DRAFT_577514 [Polyplosphaeria fusca]
MDDVPLSHSHSRCIDAFNDACEVLQSHKASDDSETGLLHAFDKYRLWAGNMGTMHKGPDYRKSLDYRLREASFYRLQVSRLLEDLRSTLRKVIELTRREDESSDADFSTGLASDEAEEESP